MADTKIVEGASCLKWRGGSTQNGRYCKNSSFPPTQGHRFCCYADDCNIYVNSEVAGQHAMEAMTGYLEQKLKLQIAGTRAPWRGLGSGNFWDTASRGTNKPVLKSPTAAWRD